jgi:hypothetical protein
VAGNGWEVRLPSLYVTNHAVLRYQQRVRAVSIDEARQALDTPTIRTAATIGAPYVRLPSKHRVVIANHAVVTVLPAECPQWRLRPTHQTEVM